jgi:hypothetical protein
MLGLNMDYRPLNLHQATCSTRIAAPQKWSPERRRFLVAGYNGREGLNATDNDVNLTFSLHHILSTTPRLWGAAPLSRAESRNVTD